MRLLHSATLEIREFAGRNVPKYAILSHTWGPEEVSYQDMTEAASRRQAGYQKIKRCGEQAAADGWEYFWVDTCCIDKRSSSELSEAINSMYRWYENAEICYVYLSDVSAAAPPYQTSDTLFTFENSRWFTPGWTLQELIAPSMIVFFDRDWQAIGTKAKLIESLENITKVDISALDGAELRHFSIARRMSWAAKRETTRAEDIAYSLMGIIRHQHALTLRGRG